MVSVKSATFFQRGGPAGGAPQQVSFYKKFYPDAGSLSAEDYGFKNFVLQVCERANEKGTAFQVASLLFKRLQDDFGTPRENRKALELSTKFGSSDSETRPGESHAYSTGVEKHEVKIALPGAKVAASIHVSQDSNKAVSLRFSFQRPSGDQEVSLYPTPVQSLPLQEMLTGFFEQLKAVASQ